MNGCSTLRPALAGVCSALVVMLLGDLFLRVTAVDEERIEPHEICLASGEGCSPGGSLLASGYNARPFDAVLHFDGPLPPDRVLLLRPFFVDRVELFSGGARIGALGDRVPRIGEARFTPHPFLSLPPGITELRVRIRTTSARTLRLLVLDIDDALALERRYAWGVASYALLMSGLLGVGVFAALRRSTALNWLFSLKLVIDTGYILAYSGVLSLVLGPALPLALRETVAHLLFVAVVLGGLLFHGRFLLELAPARWSRLFLAALAALVGFDVLAFLWILAGVAAPALELNMAVFALTTLIAMPAAFVCGRDDVPVSTAFRGLLFPAYVLLGVPFALAGSISLGLIHDPPSPLEIPLLHCGYSACMFLALLVLRERAREARIAEERRALSVARAEQDQALRHRDEVARMLLMLGHELRTPLAVMRLALGGEGERERALDRARLSLAEAEAVLERCLDAGRSESGTWRTECRPVDLRQLLDRVVAISGAPALDVRSRGHPVFRSDPELLELVLRNLVENALRHGRAGAGVRLTLGTHRDGCLVGVVSNHLEAGADLALDAIFQPGYRGARSRRQTGAGLGLYLAARGLERLGGTVRARVLGSVVSFRFRVPA